MRLRDPKDSVSYESILTNTIEVIPFASNAVDGSEIRTIHPALATSGHNGGDAGIVDSFLKLLEAGGASALLGRLLRPLLVRLYPEAREDGEALSALAENMSANLLGLGNAATPAGIRAAKTLKRGESATDSLCRLVVLNSASIQLIPATVCALRSSAGSQSPFDILPAVWFSSACSVCVGLCAAALFRRIWPCCR